MAQKPTTAEIVRADYYRQYMLGFAYIPLQDLPKYEKAFKKLNNFNKPSTED